MAAARPFGPEPTIAASKSGSRITKSHRILLLSEKVGYAEKYTVYLGIPEDIEKIRPLKRPIKERFIKAHFRAAACIFGQGFQQVCPYLLLQA
jgi:hypothetical protein